MKPNFNALPYWRYIAEGRYLGYRRHRGATGAGSWTARLRLHGRYVENALGTADDNAPPDGETVLSYRQALDAALDWWDAEERRAAGLTPRDRGPYTVARCMADYLAWYQVHRKSFEPTRNRVEVQIVPALGSIDVNALTPTAIREWHQQLATQPRRGRSVTGGPRKPRPEGWVEPTRSRKASANRILTVLKAALNMAFREGHVESDTAWRRVQPFKGVEAPRVQFLDHDHARRLLRVCEPDFRRLVQGALFTGCRYGELVALQVADYSPEISAVYIRESKSGKTRTIYLNDEGDAFFTEVTAGRPGSQAIFLRDDGTPWAAAQQQRRIAAACQAASIDPPISFHILRHTYASLYLMNGGSLPGLARQLGHADTRMTTRHYGHLAEHWRAEEARQHGPRFGGGEATVVRISRRREGEPRIPVGQPWRNREAETVSRAFDHQLLDGSA